jgi:thiol-disulfide isomerase/thioredoxin
VGSRLFLFDFLMRRRDWLVAAMGAGAGKAGAARLPDGGPGYQVQPWAQRGPTPAVPEYDEAGRTWRLGQLRGRAVLLNFWATWCEPCRAEMPALQTLAARESDRVQVLTINLKESPETIARFVAATGLHLPVLRDPMGDCARAWGVRIYPSTVLLDTGGHPRALVRGALDWAGPEGEALWRPLLQAARKR